MSATLNMFCAIGRLKEDLVSSQDPKSPVKMTDNGGLVVNTSIATNTYWTDKETGRKMERTDWHNICAFGYMADRIESLSPKKGSLVYVQGPMRTRSWEDNDGNTRYKTECTLRDFQICTPKNADIVVASNDEDDIPFPVEEGETRMLDDTKEKWAEEYKKYSDTHDSLPTPEAIEAGKKNRSVQSGSSQEAPQQTAPKSKYL